MKDPITISDAKQELKIAERQNPGLWIAHSYHVGAAAKYIAEACKTLDVEKAYICGILHDIGRRNGKSALKHAIDGYEYAMSKGWNSVARICLTHSFPVKDITTDISKADINEKQYQFMKRYLEETEYDDYDKLIILCDSLADAQGFCILEKRFVDTTCRYGIYPFTIDRWKQTYQYKEYFEKMLGASVYTLLPNIDKCIYS
ncbi:HD domain-containing protein [Faecalicatena acetigenes]|jgi:putative nucleotidyltransferase with HDIG domain|uniref:HD domain-containing protein n=1 Tax=Faecalicatena acetigenes TaxID=2981790 RepID=A0ABT2TEY4_9FIRM|nr:MULTISPECIES: HD domain-containing protein [Lachnospiraceae]MCU6748346.1 HD domain-containing protein [Faecalicatena acetigenes]SCI39557.1 Predicted HD superfamily hydrolase [uncultured Clostridium sp.]